MCMGRTILCQAGVDVVALLHCNNNRYHSAAHWAYMEERTAAAAHSSCRGAGRAQPGRASMPTGPPRQARGIA
jgi:hypothetical protein